MKPFKCVCFLAAMLCVGLQASIKEAIDSGNVEQVNAAINAAVASDQPVLNEWSVRIELKDRWGNMIPVAVTPLVYAVIVNASPEVVNALFAAGADPSIQDTRFADTALHHAVRNNNQTLTELILKNAKGKSLTDIKNFSDLSPLDEAQDDAMKKLIKKYETWGAKLGRGWHKLGGSLPHDPEGDV